MCRVLKTNIGPAIARILQNDKEVVKAPPLLDRYNLLLGAGSSLASEGAQGQRQIGGQGNQGALDLTLERMERLADRMADNLVTAETLLNDPAMLRKMADTNDESQLTAIRERLERVLAEQRFAMNVVGGFVDTQQLHELQYQGFGYIPAVTSSNEIKHPNGMPTPPPMLFDQKLQAGLPPNPYAIDPSMIPGLTVGYNPIKNLIGALRWTQARESQDEARAAKSVMQAVRSCSAPPPTPKP